MRSKRKNDKNEVFPQIRITLWEYQPSSSDIIVSEYNVGYSKIIIVKKVDSPVMRYMINDPIISEHELKLLNETASELVYLIQSSGVSDIKSEISKLLESKGVKRQEIHYLLAREIYGFGPIDPLINDPNLENIECNEAGRPLTVTHIRYGRMETNLIFSEYELDRLVQRLAHMTEKSISRAKPKLDNAILPGGHRLSCTYASEISPSSTFVIRKFPQKPWTIARLLVNGTLSPEIAAWLWMLVENKLAILIAGEMGSGKTSLANSLCGLIPPWARIGTAEDAPEFKIPHKNWTRRTTRDDYTLDGDSGKISLFQLIKHLLRSNVDYIIVNEVRGEEARDWIQAISTGHGGITTIHASSPIEAVNRLHSLGVEYVYLNSLYNIVLINRIVKRLPNSALIVYRVCTAVYDVDIKRGEDLENSFKLLFRYDMASQRFIHQTPRELSLTRAAKEIMARNGWDTDSFVREYTQRVEFLELIKKRADKDPSLYDVDTLFLLFEKFYTDKRDEIIKPKPEEVRHEVSQEDKIKPQPRPRIITVENISGERKIKIINIKKRSRLSSIFNLPKRKAVS